MPKALQNLQDDLAHLEVRDGRFLDSLDEKRHEQVAVIEAHTGEITALAWSPDGSPGAWAVDL